MTNTYKPGVDMNDSTPQSVRHEIPPFGMVPRDLACDPSIPAQAVRVYAVLAAKWADRDTRSCHPSRKSIAEKAGCSANTVDRCMEVLTRSGWISVRGRIDSDGRQTSNEYLLHMAARPTHGDLPLPMGDALPSPLVGNELEPSELEPLLRAHVTADEHVGREPQPPPASAPTQELTAKYVDYFAHIHGGRAPDSRWRGAAGKAIKAAVREGHEPDVIRRCLWVIANENKNPSVLPNVLADYYTKKAEF